MFTIDNIFTEYRDIVTSKELQEMLNMGRNTVMNLLKSGEIPSMRVGRVYKIPKLWAIDYLNECEE